MIVQVKLFAVARQLAGAETVELELPDGANVGQLRTALQTRLPELAEFGTRLLFSLDAEYAADGDVVREDIEIACIPPVSGG